MNPGSEYLEIVRRVHCPVFQKSSYEATTGHTHVPKEGNDTSALRKKYLQALDKYNSIEKQIQEAALRSRSKASRFKLRPYLGKRARLPDGDLIYVNDYGYTTAYVGSPTTLSSTCNSQVVQIPPSKVGFLEATGATASHALPCGLAGKNIQNEDTKETAWVDVKGIKHVYSSAIWKSKQAACNVFPLALPAHEYAAFPSGSAMQSASPCLTIDVDPHLWTEKQKALNYLLQVTAEVEGRTNELESQDAEINKTTKAARLLRMHIESEQGETQPGISDKTEGDRLVLVSSRLHRFVLVLLGFTVLAVVVFGSGKPGDGILLAGCLVAMYAITRSLWWLVDNY